ncbi:DUF1127 domain-containing protein [Bradyrhizobium erythrophlei]|uniref:DUF1127 domain-containing protein n=1 Tax=Bradyrhizobium erythrophlei TaxID=1437360 RepID=UPI0035E70195
MTTNSILMRATRPRPLRAALNCIAACATGFADFCDRREAIKQLESLDDHQLRDLGVARCRIAQAVHGKAGSRIWEIDQ